MVPNLHRAVGLAGWVAMRRLIAMLLFLTSCAPEPLMLEPTREPTKAPAVIITRIITATASPQPVPSNTIRPTRTPRASSTAQPTITITKPPVRAATARSIAVTSTRRPAPTWTPIPIVLPTDTPYVAPANCSPAYPDFCIPPPPPDLDCKDVRPHRRFRALPPDPHNFDADGNGIGCES